MSGSTAEFSAWMRDKQAAESLAEIVALLGASVVRQDREWVAYVAAERERVLSAARKVLRPNEYQLIVDALREDEG